MTAETNTVALTTAGRRVEIEVTRGAAIAKRWERGVATYLGLDEAREEIAELVAAGWRVIAA